MIARKIKIKQADKSSAKKYLKKAQDNHKQMLVALADNNYNAVGTLAIQCAISSADAICIHEKGLRSVSQDHLDVCDLVRSIPLPDSKENSNILKRIISMKNLIQYENRIIYQTEANNIAKAANKFYQWIVTIIKK